MAERPATNADDSGRVRLVEDVVVPIAIRLVEMGVALVLVARWTGTNSVLSRLTTWDGSNFRDIADHWYPPTITWSGSHLITGAQFAFAPLYPILTYVVRLTGVSIEAALVIAASGAGLAASVLVHLLGRRVVGTRRAGYIACALLGALPMAVIFQMGYAESLATALTAAALLAVVDRHWWWGAGFSCLAGLARPSAAVVALAIPVVAWSMRRERRVPWATVAGATVVGASGAPLFWLYVGVRSGVLDGWFVVERLEWHSHFDFGAATWQFLRLAGDQDHVMAVLAVLSILGFVLAWIAAIRQNFSPPLVVVSVLSVVVALGSSNYWHSKPRILLAAFPLVVLAARPLSKLPDRALVIGITAAVVASSVFSAYAVVSWPHAI